MFRGSVLKGKNLEGFIQDQLIVPGTIKSRHDELVVEMERRGFNHKSPLVAFSEVPPPDVARRIQEVSLASTAELIRRCPACRMRIEGKP